MHYNRSMLSRLFKTLILIFAATVALVYLRTGSSDFLFQIKDRVLSLESKEDVGQAIGELAEAVKQEISNPSPLISKIQSSRAHLTHDGVLQWTNSQRMAAAGLPALRANTELDAIAEERLRDMFEKQYFEHINPEGEGASDIADEIDYRYIAIGENIALGNFDDDQVLVQAWMDSPGHRANILNEKYTEIGIAVATGTYEKRRTWMGVQVFAKPVNDCPSVDPHLKNSISANTSQMDSLKVRIDTLQRQLDDMREEGNFNRNEYNQKVNEYNELVRQFNTLNGATKLLVNRYNDQVKAFNACIK